MTETKSKELTLVRTFDAPRELVFKAWTDPKLIAQWWGPDGVTNPVCEVDAKAGGEIYIVMEAGEELGDLKGQKWPMRGTFKTIDPPRLISYTSSAIMDGKPVIDGINTVTFEEADGKTTMTLHIKITKEYEGSEGPLAGMEIGWGQSLNKLVRFIQK